MYRASSHERPKPERSQDDRGSCKPAAHMGVLGHQQHGGDEEDGAEAGRGEPYGPHKGEQRHDERPCRFGSTVSWSTLVPYLNLYPRFFVGTLQPEYTV